MAKKRSKRSGGIAWIHYLKKDYSLDSTLTRKNLLRGLYQGEVRENGNRWAVRLYHEAISDGLGPLASWDTSLALCKKVDMKHFFADGSRALAKKVCERCPIKEECLDIAIKCNISHGIWGGMTPHERGHRRSGQSRYEETAVKKVEEQPRNLLPCGTIAAARRHQRANEPLCSKCKPVWAQHQANMYQQRTKQQQEEIIFIVETKHKQDQENTNYLDVKWHVTP